MKKLSVLLVSLVIILGSCSKDEVRGIEKKQALVGTVWSGASDGVLITLSFYESTATYQIDAGLVKYSSSYKYTYGHPVAILTPDDPKQAELKITVKGGFIEVVNMSTDKMIQTLYKQ